MANETELVVKISGNIDGFQKSLDRAEKQTEALNDQLKKITKISGIAFAGLVTVIGASTKAYAESEEAANRLNLSLKNQGIFTDELSSAYREHAQAISLITGVSDEQIVQGQALAQAYLGEIKFTKELTQAIVDLAVAKGIDLVTAFELVGKSIGTSTNALARQGIQFTESASKAEKLNQFLEQAKSKFDGFAEASASGANATKVLFNLIGEAGEELGQRFAPLVNKITQGFISLFKIIQDNPALFDFVAALTIAGTILTGLTTAVGVFGTAFLNLRNIMIAANVQISTTTLLLRTLAGATGIGLLVVGLTYLIENWERVFFRMSEIAGAFSKNFIPLMKEVANNIKLAFVGSKDEVQESLKRIGEITDEMQKGFTSKFVSNEEKKNNDIEKEKVRHQDEMDRLSDEAFARDAEKRILWNEEILAQNEEFNALSEEQRLVFKQQYDAQLQEQFISEKDAAALNARESIDRQIKSHNEFLKNQQKFGTAYATLNRIMHSEVVQGAAKGFGELAQLQQSSNSTLKSIGKAAAIANIIMQTATSAMNIYAGFSTIPIIGPALGIAGAAAAVAFGAEQLGKVNGAAEGALVTGGIRGKDSVPFMLQAGEIVAPETNFEEVIGSIRAKREADKIMETTGVSPTSGQTIVNIQGNVMADNDEQVDNLIVRIRDAIEFRNAQLIPG